MIRALCRLVGELGNRSSSGKPVTLFGLPENAEYHVVDGKRFLVNEPADPVSGALFVIVNWKTRTARVGVLNRGAVLRLEKKSTTLRSVLWPHLPLRFPSKIGCPPFTRWGWSLLK
jgi:hypothetical protein